MSGPAELRRVMITGERLLVTDIRIKLLLYTKDQSAVEIKRYPFSRTVLWKEPVYVQLLAKEAFRIFYPHSSFTSFNNFNSSNFNEN